jgi:hypothetical protein
MKDLALSRTHPDDIRYESETIQKNRELCIIELVDRIVYAYMYDNKTNLVKKAFEDAELWFSDDHGFLTMCFAKNIESQQFMTSVLTSYVRDRFDELFYYIEEFEDFALEPSVNF